MSLAELIDNAGPPEPWAEGENIPWDEPGFSERMLKEHLNPEHDAASRRPELIDQQVVWIHDEILGGTPTRILDLGCGPGLYAVRLAKLGHEVVGIDISPASLEHARKLAAEAGANCEFIEADFRSMALDREFGLAMQIYGELNVFRRSQAAEIVQRSADVLKPGGRLVMEVDRPETTSRLGEPERVWRRRSSGLFSDRPHLYLQESFWDEAQRVATTRYWVVDAASGEVERFAQSFAAYEADEYRSMFASAGLRDIELISDYPGGSPSGDDQRWMVTGKRPS